MTTHGLYSVLISAIERTWGTLQVYSVPPGLCSWKSIVTVQSATHDQPYRSHLTLHDDRKNENCHNAITQCSSWKLGRANLCRLSELGRPGFGACQPYVPRAPRALPGWKGESKLRSRSETRKFVGNSVFVNNKNMEISDSMQLSLPWEANSRSSGQTILRLWCNPKVHCNILKTPQRALSWVTQNLMCSVRDSWKYFCPDSLTISNKLWGSTMTTAWLPWEVEFVCDQRYTFIDFTSLTCTTI
jgi:hypothetical protein